MVRGGLGLDSSQMDFSLHSSEALNVLFNGMQDGCIAVNKQWRILYVNDVVTRRLSKAADTLIGQDMVEQFPEALNYRLFRQYPAPHDIQESYTFQDYYPPLALWLKVSVYPSSEGLLLVLHNLNTVQPSKTGDDVRHLVEMVPQHAMDVISYKDPEGRFSYVSPSIYKLLGYRPYELVGKRAADYIHVDDVQAVGNALSGEAIRNNEVLLTYRMLHANGTYYWFETTVKQISDQEHADRYVYLCISREVTERKELEERFEITQKLGRFGGWERDRDGQYIYISPEVEEILGTAAELACRLPLTSDMLLCYIHPDDRERYSHNIVHTHQQPPGYRYNYELRMLRPEGGFRNVRIQGEVVQRSGGRIHVVGLLQDISEHRQRELEIRRIRENLKLSQQMGGLGYFDYNLQLNQVFWSKELYTMLEIVPGDFDGTVEGFYERVHPDDVGQVKQAIQHCIHGDTYDTVLRMILPDGKVIQLHTIGSLIYDEAGEPLCLFGMVQNISEKKQAEELLRKSEKLSAAGQLAAGIAHEIRNPLTALKGFAKLLLRAENETRVRYFNIMQSEFDRIELILGELLLLAKPQTPQYKMNHLSHIIQEVVELLSTQANLANVMIDLDMESDLPMLYCEANQLKQVFVNVIKNGIESMTGGGHLRIKLRLEDGSLCILFADEGKGMHPAQLERVGEPFYTTKDKGTGLGMLVSFNIIDEHHGSIRYYSQVDHGTTVKVKLPLQ